MCAACIGDPVLKKFSLKYSEFITPFAGGESGNHMPIPSVIHCLLTLHYKSRNNLRNTFIEVPSQVFFEFVLHSHYIHCSPGNERGWSLGFVQHK